MPTISRAPFKKLLLNAVILAFLACVPFLVLAAIQLPIINRLTANIQALRPGMSISQVEQQMGGKPSFRFDTPRELQAGASHVHLTPLPQSEKMRGPLLIYAFKNEGSDCAYLYFDRTHRLVEITTP